MKTVNAAGQCRARFASSAASSAYLSSEGSITTTGASRDTQKHADRLCSHGGDQGWLGYLHRLMKIMRDRNKINDQELLDGSEVITYQVAKSPRVRPSGDIQRDLGGDIPWLAPEGP